MYADYIREDTSVGTRATSISLSQALRIYIANTDDNYHWYSRRVFVETVVTDTG